jgi:energy-coupling factor transport system permease protein
MDARGFDSGIPRSNARGSRLHRRDAWFVVGTGLVCAVAVTLSVVCGAWAPVFVGG